MHKIIITTDSASSLVGQLAALGINMTIQIESEAVAVSAAPRAPAPPIAAPAPAPAKAPRKREPVKRQRVRARVAKAATGAPAAKVSKENTGAKESTDDRLVKIRDVVAGGSSQFSDISTAMGLPRGAMRGLIEKAKERKLIFMAGKLGGSHYGVTQAQADERAGKGAPEVTKDTRPVGPVKKRAARSASAGGE